MNYDYIKDYREKELKQYILASFFIVIASIGLNMFSIEDRGTKLSALIETLSIDFLEGAACVLVYIFTELWGNVARIWIVYKTLPSDTVFTEIEQGKFKTVDFDIAEAKTKYRGFSQKSGAQQTTEWNQMLRKARENDIGSVVEAERCQLLTRDICMTTVTLFIANVVAGIIVAIVLGSVLETLRLFTVPFAYLLVMFFVTRCVAKSKAKRLVGLVIKNDLINSDEKRHIIMP